jgi:hypothetical protein
MDVPETDLLAELIRSKHACLIRLREMGRRQLELIERGEITPLLDLLAEKQRSIMELQQIERDLEPFRGRDPDHWRWRKPEDRSRCAEQLRECEALLSEIVGQEKRSEKVLSRRRDEAAKRLQGVHLAGQARGAYTAGPESQISQLDLSSDR